MKGGSWTLGGRKVGSWMGVAGMGFLEGTPGKGLLEECSRKRGCWKVGGRKGVPVRWKEGREPPVKVVLQKGWLLDGGDWKGSPGRRWQEGVSFK